ncbi:MAG: alpha/beta fold hydrolase [Pseudomonadota bacterium]
MTLALAHIEHPASEAETDPPLLIAHGLYGSGRNFNSLGKSLATNRRVVMVDMRNHGASPWDAEMTYPAMAADLASAARDLCGGQATVLGHSMGGKAAMALALSQPDLVAGLIVADIAPVAYDHGHEAYIDAMQAVDLSAITRRSDADPMLAAAIPEKMLRAFLLQNLIVEGGVARWRLNLDALKRSLPTLLDWPAAWPHDGYDGPTLFLHGGASDYVTEDMRPSIRGLFPRAEFETLAGAGHWLHAEQPQDFLAAVARFLTD